MATPFTRQKWSLWLQPDGPNTEMKYLGCHTLDDLESPGQGIAEIWEVIETFRRQTTVSGVFEAQRQRQVLDWMQELVEEHLFSRFFNQPGIQEILPHLEQAVLNGEIPPTLAAQKLLEKFEAETK